MTEVIVPHPHPQVQAVQLIKIHVSEVFERTPRPSVTSHFRWITDILCYFSVAMSHQVIEGTISVYPKYIKVILTSMQPASAFDHEIPTGSSITFPLPARAARVTNPVRPPP